MKRMVRYGAAALATALTFNYFYTRHLARQQANAPFHVPDLILEHPDAAAEQRLLTLPGAFNVRDIGGYQTADGRQVRWGQVYRAGSLSYLTDEGLAQLQAWGIHTICDLRTSHEAETMPTRLPDGVTYRHMPLHERGEGRGRILATLTFRPHRINDLVLYGYINLMIEKRAHLIGDILRLIADPANRPILLHCTAGKDRTGLTIALLLTLLGVPDEAIMADFSLSNLFYEEVRRSIERDAARLAVFGIQANNLRPFLVAHPDSLRLTLAHIRQKYGTVENYVCGRGRVEPTLITQLQNELLL